MRGQLINGVPYFLTIYFQKRTGLVIAHQDRKGFKSKEFAGQRQRRFL